MGSASPCWIQADAINRLVRHSTQHIKRDGSATKRRRAAVVDNLVLPRRGGAGKEPLPSDTLM